MEVLDLKKPRAKKIIAYMAKSERNDVKEGRLAGLEDFIKEKGVNFLTIDFNIDMKSFKVTDFGKALDKKGIPFYQVDIPEYAMGYIYEEISEKEELLNSLCDEYENMEDKDSFKGESILSCFVK